MSEKEFLPGSIRERIVDLKRTANVTDKTISEETGIGGCFFVGAAKSVQALTSCISIKSAFGGFPAFTAGKVSGLIPLISTKGYEKGLFSLESKPFPLQKLHIGMMLAFLSPFDHLPYQRRFPFRESGLFCCPKCVSP